MLLLTMHRCGHFPPAEPLLLLPLPPSLLVFLALDVCQRLREFCEPLGGLALGHVSTSKFRRLATARSN